MLYDELIKDRGFINRERKKERSEIHEKAPNQVHKGSDISPLYYNR